MPAYSDDVVELIWRKGAVEPGYDPSKWRKDFAGAWIRHDLYGTQHKYGWAIDHLVPRSHGGSDTIENLMPLHWKNNICKAGNAPVFRTIVSSDGNKNVERERQWRIPNQD